MTIRFTMGVLLAAIGATTAGGGTFDGSDAAEASPASFESGPVCLSGSAVSDLDRLFDTEPGGVIGADYQRALALPDGRVLWTFQDAAIRLGSDEITIVHNIAVMQDRSCFTVLYGGSRNDPRPMFFSDRTQQYQHWFWPLDATVGEDGRVYVYAAEMEERGGAYLTHTVPLATWVAIFDPTSDTVVDELHAPDSSADLYGWSITSDDDWTFFYAHCYRQFGFDDYALVAAFDRSCATEITVARVPVGELFEPLRYWDGAAWQPDPSRAEPIIETRGRQINADQFEWTGARFVSVNKEGDWWGDTIILSKSLSPYGPFEVYDEVAAPVKCAECNSFFATWIPAVAVGRAENSLVISLAHNRWDGVITSLYRPTFHHVDAPTHLPAGSAFELTLPAGADSAAINVATVEPHEPGFVTVYPCASGLPLASNLNHAIEPVVSNLVLARPDPSGRVCLYSLAETDLVVDLAGSFSAGSTFSPAERQARLVDTRTGNGGVRVPANGVLQVAVPSGSTAAAVALNVAAVLPSAAGHLTVYPCDRPRPATSNINYGSEPVVSNLVVAVPSANGTVCIASHAETDLVVDLAGTFDDGFATLDDSVRLVDTRGSIPVGRLDAGGVVSVAVPESAGTAVLNVIAVQPDRPGFLTVYPCDVDRPLASNVNFIERPVVSNLVFARVGDDGRVCIFSSSGSDIVVDWFGTLPPASGFEPRIAPVRLVDTRIGTGVPGQLGVR